MRRLYLPASLIYFTAFVSLVLAGLSLLMIHSVDVGFTQPFTRGLVIICQAAMQLFGAPVTASGVVLAFRDGHGSVSVCNGCNAVEVCILFAAAVLAFPAPLFARAVGATVGVLALQAFNFLRIISLLIVARYAQGLFDFFHLYVWDAFIMVDAVALFLTWHNWQSGRGRNTGLVV